jgi:hypothetical protein
VNLVQPAANTALRVALRDAIEPGWVEKEVEP